MNHTVHQALIAWSIWHKTRFQDRSMGYPKSSPIANFGMPPSTGAVWDGPITCTHDSMAMQQRIWKLPVDDVIKLTVYYIKTHCNARESGRILDIDGKTVKAHIERIQDTLHYMDSADIL